MIELHPLRTIGEVEAGSDLAGLLTDALVAADLSPRPFDILVVTQKIVSKAEDRLVSLSSLQPGPQACELAEITAKDPRMVELALAESTDVVRAVRNVLITRHRSGFVMANAGIDQSNIGPDNDGKALLLPLDADASADRLREGLAARCEHPPAVVISDSFGRPWRNGVVTVAIGASGLPSLIDRRGEIDRDGRRLEVTQVAFADLIAAAAGLAMGEGAEGVPAVLVRGTDWTAPEAPAASLVRQLTEDLFR